MSKFDYSLEDIMNAFANTNIQKKRKKVQYGSEEDKEIALMRKQMYGFDGRFDQKDWSKYRELMKTGCGVDLHDNLSTEIVPTYENDNETVKQVYIHVIIGTNLSKRKQMGISFRFIGRQTDCPNFNNFGQVIEKCVIGTYWPLDKETGKPTIDQEKAEWAITLKTDKPASAIDNI